MINFWESGGFWFLDSGCTRGFWNSRANYDESSGHCKEQSGSIDMDNDAAEGPGDVDAPSEDGGAGAFSGASDTSDADKAAGNVAGNAAGRDGEEANAADDAGDAGSMSQTGP